jgi:hypothetical protein
VNPNRILLGALGALALTTALGSSALAAPPTTAAPTSQAAPDTRGTAHASLRLDVRRTKAWVGQAVPVTLQAYFRNAEGVTLEGAPQLTSATGIFTSDLGREPRQSTAVVNGEPVLVATWTGTMAASTAAPLTLSAQLPVRVRYRDAPPHVEQAAPPVDDLFGALVANPFDRSAIDRFFQQSMGQSQGRLHEEVVSLRATAGPIAVLDLPTANQPASFTGAIGKFNLKASLSSTHAQVSEPVTLRLVVDGDGDLDRVDLTGVATSSDWKAYPPKSILVAAAEGQRARKVFEQVLVPLHGGDLSVPPVSLAAFDPDTAGYVTRETQPFAVAVEGSAAAADPPLQSAPMPVASTTATPAPAPSDTGPFEIPRVVAPRKLAMWLSPLAPLVALAAFSSHRRRKRGERVLRRTMRKAAARGDVVPFYQAAHALIEMHLASRWGVAPESVGAMSIRDRLGAVGEPLVEALAADEALRFGRGTLDNPDLSPLCSSIERCLGGAS